MTKYKYYFKKPKSEIAKDILKLLAVSGMVCIAASSPYFILNILKNFKKFSKYKNKKIYDTFYNLEKNKDININEKNHQIYISLTKKGRKKAGWLQIDSLKIKRNKKWDGKWRIIMFDISELKKFQREAFRGKLKELDFLQLQKSVWLNPFNCSDEVGILRGFFGLSQKEVRLVTAIDIGDSIKFKKFFRIT